MAHTLPTPAHSFAGLGRVFHFLARFIGGLFSPRTGINMWSYVRRYRRFERLSALTTGELEALGEQPQDLARRLCGLPKAR